MKKILNAFFIGSALLASTITFAQTKEEAHIKLAGHHKTAKEHANKIVNGEASTKEAQKQHAVETKKSIENAKVSHTELKKAIPEKHKEAAKTHHEIIDKHHADATVHHAKLETELSKPNPDAAKVKEHAKATHTSLENAEKEHQKLKTKTSAK
ncbi:MAG: hypothetical protein H7282_15610 [Cytophagaceae bacterium]|nr:hypothetical protein [Cytophagaceae bacterium]